MAKIYSMPGAATITTTGTDKIVRRHSCMIKQKKNHQLPFTLINNLPVPLIYMLSE